MRLVGYVLDYMLNHMLDYMIIDLVTMLLSFYYFSIRFLSMGLMQSYSFTNT